jgi:hypothetical protein
MLMARRNWARRSRAPIVSRHLSFPRPACSRNDLHFDATDARTASNPPQGCEEISGCERAHAHLGAIRIRRFGLSEACNSSQAGFDRNKIDENSRKGVFWQDRYHATAIESGDHLWRSIVYVDLNMIRAGAVDHPSNWPFKSGRPNISGESCFLPMPQP